MPTSANRLLSGALRALPGPHTREDYDEAPPRAQALWLADYRAGHREAFHADLLPHLAALAETEAIRERLQDEAAMERLLSDFADELSDLNPPDTPAL